MEGSGSSGNVVIRILKFLLFKLWLWVPVAYSLLFVIVVAVTHTAFSSVWGIYVIGLCITLVLAIAFACTNFVRQIGKKKVGEGRSSSYAKETNTDRNKAQFVAGVSGDNSTPIIRSAPQDQQQPQQPQQSQQPNSQQQPYNQQPYSQPYGQPYSQQQPQQSQNVNLSNGTNGNGGETSTSSTPNFFSYNIDNGPQRQEYTGGDPGFFSYYPERDAANNADSFGINNNFSRDGSNDFSRGGDNGFNRDSGNDFSRNSGNNFSRDNVFSRDSSNDFSRGSSFNNDNGFSRNDGFSRDGNNGFGSDNGFSRDGGSDFNRDNGSSREGGSDFSRGGFGGSGTGDFSGQSYSRGSTDGIIFPSAVPEKPAIFRTRMDPNMLIYEYSDRLEFYKITDNGPILLSSEYKNNNNR